MSRCRAGRPPQNLERRETWRRTASRRSTRHSSTWKRRRPTCTWAGRPPSIPPTSGPHRASSSFATTSRGACIAPPATASAWPACRSGLARPAVGRRRPLRHHAPCSAGRPAQPRRAGGLGAVHAARPRAAAVGALDRRPARRRAHRCRVQGASLHGRRNRRGRARHRAARPGARPAAGPARRLGARGGARPGAATGGRRWSTRTRDQLALAGSAARLARSPRKLASGAQRASRSARSTRWRRRARWTC